MRLLFNAGGSRAAACTLFMATDVEVAGVVEDKSKYKQGEDVTGLGLGLGLGARDRTRARG